MKEQEVKLRLEILRAEEARLKDAERIIDTIKQWRGIIIDGQIKVVCGGYSTLITHEEFELLRDFRIKRLMDELEAMDG